RTIFLGQWGKVLDALRPGAEVAFFHEGLAALLTLTFVVAIRASASITGEKEKGTWLALMLTTLSTQEIVAGKHRGLFWACMPYIAAHATVTVPLAAVLGFWPTMSAVCANLTMVLTVAVGAAIGIWCSTRTASSWRSLLTTLIIYCLLMVPLFLGC